MKDKRNCQNNIGNYPIYQPQMMMPPMGYPVYPNYPNNFQGTVSNNTYEQQLNNIQTQINQLDQRITRLENMNNNTNNNYNKYNDSNYYMV